MRVLHGSPSLFLRLTNFLAYLFLILVNVLSSAGALGGTNAEVSAKFPSPLTPAEWAFAIWGLIFALEGLGVIYQLMNSGYREGSWKASVVDRIGYGWQVGWLMQDLWQFAFVRENVSGMWLAAFALLAALGAFQFTLYRLNGTTHELRARGYPAMPPLAYAFYKLPTAINAAWLSVAAALGILIVPVSYGVSQSRLVAPAAVLMVAVTSGGMWRVLRHRDAAYGFTLIWALSAVASNGSGNVPQAIKIVGIVCLVLLALCIISALVRTHREHSTAANSAATGVGGNLLSDPYSSAYGLYGDQRMLLSEPDTPAGLRRESSGSFTFPPIQPPAAFFAVDAGGAGPFSPRPSTEGVMVAVSLGVGSTGPGGKGKPLSSSQLLSVDIGDGADVVSSGGVGAGFGGVAALQWQAGQTPGGETSSVWDGGVESCKVSGSGRRVRFQDEEATKERQ